MAREPEPVGTAAQRLRAVLDGLLEGLSRQVAVGSAVIVAAALAIDQHPPI